MSGSTLPYRLRPHKAVDRRLFIELLARCERWKTLEKHAYVSMASYTMEDQKLIHRLLGIQRLLAFDFDQEIVRRQHFNRPIGDAKCIHSTANDLTADIDSALVNAGITDHAGYVVWLDYTNPNDIGEQLREFEQLAAQFAPSDIVRVTVNAHYDWWAGRLNPAQPRTVEQRQQRAFTKLQTSIGDFLPHDLTSADLSEEGLAKTLARAFGMVADRAVPAHGGRTLVPLSIVRYADGMQMLSMTAMVCATEEIDGMREKLGMNTWPFHSMDWTDVKFLAVPDLTVRERLYLEQHIEEDDAAIAQGLGFNLDDVTEMDGFLSNFRGYYRHYPALSPVEL